MSIESFAFPSSLIPSLSGFVVRANSSLEIDRISGFDHVQDYAGERWMVEMRFAILRRNEVNLLRGHLNDLRGSVNISRVVDLSFTQAGLLPGAPVVDGAGQYGRVLNVRGLVASAVVAEPGQRFKLGNRVHEVTRQAVSTAAGAATVPLANEILELTSDGQAISVIPSGLDIRCRWADPRQIEQLIGNRSYVRNVRLNFLESFQ